MKYYVEYLKALNAFVLEYLLIPRFINLLHKMSRNRLLGGRGSSREMLADTSSRQPSVAQSRSEDVSTQPAKVISHPAQERHHDNGFHHSTTNAGSGLKSRSQNCVGGFLT